jgi:hypothetical protein
MILKTFVLLYWACEVIHGELPTATLAHPSDSEKITLATTSSYGISSRTSTLRSESVLEEATATSSPTSPFAQFSSKTISAVAKDGSVESNDKILIVTSHQSKVINDKLSSAEKSFGSETSETSTSFQNDFSAVTESSTRYEAQKDETSEQLATSTVEDSSTIEAKAFEGSESPKATEETQLPTEEPGTTTSDFSSTAETTETEQTESSTLNENTTVDDTETPTEPSTSTTTTDDSSSSTDTTDTTEMGEFCHFS